MSRLHINISAAAAPSFPSTQLRPSRSPSPSPSFLFSSRGNFLLEGLPPKFVWSSLFLTVANVKFMPNRTGKGLKDLKGKIPSALPSPQSINALPLDATVEIHSFSSLICVGKSDHNSWRIRTSD